MPEELEQLLEAWEDACTFAHGGQCYKTPALVAARLMQAGEDIVNYIKDSQD